MAPSASYRLDWFKGLHTGSVESVRLAVKRSARRSLKILLGLVWVAAVSAVFLSVMGYRPLIVRSGSMTPSLLTGDLIITHAVAPSSVQVGQIITFADPSRRDSLVTHRVIATKRRGEMYWFLTKGDSNARGEEWTISGKERVGKFTFRLPKLGYGISVLSNAGVRIALVALLLASPTKKALTKIWS